MFLIQQITADAKQRQTLLLPDGSAVTLTLEYKDQQLGWFISNLLYGTFQINNFRVFTSPNLLRQYKNQIPFGLGCFADGNQEPTLINDFLSGRARLYILPQEDVTEFEEILSGTAS